MVGYMLQFYNLFLMKFLNQFSTTIRQKVTCIDLDLVLVVKMIVVILKSKLLGGL